MARSKKPTEDFHTSEDLLVERRKRIADLIDDDYDFSTTPSEIMKTNTKPEKKKVYVEEPESADTMEWMTSLENLRKPMVHSKSVKNFLDDDYNYYGKKKRKKKKKKDGEVISYDDEFDRETAIIRNLLQEQTKFTNSLQQRYNILDQQKSSARGVGKFTTDLISGINSARSLSKDLAKELINTKKTICELNIKERDRLAKKHDDSDDFVYASKYLKGLMSVNKGDFEYDESDIDDINNGDEMFGDIVNSMESNDAYVERSENSNKFLKYENQKVEVRVTCDHDGENAVFYAVNEAGDILDDYPVPLDTKVTVNPSTMVAIDRFGEKYPAEFR